MNVAWDFLFLKFWIPWIDHRSLSFQLHLYRFLWGKAEVEISESKLHDRVRRWIIKHANHHQKHL